MTIVVIRLLLAATGAAISVAAAALALAVWLWWAADPSDDQRSRGINALWAAHTWVGDPHSDGEYRAFADRMRAHDISDLFFHAGPLEADGSVPPEKIQYADELLAAVERHAPELRTQAYLGQIEARAGGILDLDDPAVRDGIIDTVDIMLDLGFEGIHYDIEPIRPGDESFLELLERTRAVTEPRGAVLSVALEQMEVMPRTQRLIRMVTSSDYHDPTEDFLQDVAERTDQVAIMTYDTGAFTDWMFGAHVAWQTESVVEAVGDDVTVFIGVPTHEDESLKFHSWAENIHAGVRGVRKGLDRLDETRTRNVGIAIFAEWTTSDDEWQVYADQWLPE